MSNKVGIKEGSGRAICGICNRKIHKGQEAIWFRTYNTSTQVHANGINCKR